MVKYYRYPFFILASGLKPNIVYKSYFKIDRSANLTAFFPSRLCRHNALNSPMLFLNV